MGNPKIPSGTHASTEFIEFVKTNEKILYSTFNHQLIVDNKLNESKFFLISPVSPVIQFI